MMLSTKSSWTTSIAPSRYWSQEFQHGPTALARIFQLIDYCAQRICGRGVGSVDVVVHGRMARNGVNPIGDGVIH
jgi:hypothetical protein